MKAAVVSTVPVFPCTGGNRARIANFIRSLEALGVTVDFVYLPSRQVTDADFASHLSHFSPGNFHVLRRPPHRDVSYYSRRAIGKMLRKLKRWRGSESCYYYGLDEIYFDGFTPQLKKLARERRYGAVFVQYVYNSKAFGAFGHDTLKILDTHDSYADRHRRYLERGSGFHGYSVTEDNQIQGFLRADIILAIQEEEAAGFRSALGSHAARVKTISHLLDLSRRVDGLENCGATFIGSSFGENLEAVAFFIRECLPRILPTRPEFRLFIAGSVCDQILDSPNLVKLGIVPHVADAFARGPIALNPTRLGSGINIKLLEAMACGVPGVSTATGARGIPEGFRAGLAVVPDDDPAAYATAILELLDRPERRQAMGEAAHAMAERWNSIQIAALRNVLSSAKARSLGSQGPLDYAEPDRRRRA